MEIETNTTINVKIGDYEFNLTKEESEELYNSLKNSLGKNDTKQPPLYTQIGNDQNRSTPKGYFGKTTLDARFYL